MLVVTRRQGERIVLPEIGVEIVVTKILENRTVRIGVSAPKELRILRKEILSRAAAKR